MNMNKFIIFDYETTSKNPDIAEIFQIGAIITDRNLKVLDEFEIKMKPEHVELAEDDALRVTGKTREEINKYPPTSIMWPSFTEWIDKHNTENSIYTAPIPMGYNIIGYDLPITRRYCKKHKTGWDNKRNDQKIFSQVYKFDLMDHLWFWFENNGEVEKLKLEILMEYMGFTKEEIYQAHDAMKDVRNTFSIIKRLFGVQRYMTEMKADGKRRMEMKGAFIQ